MLPTILSLITKSGVPEILGQLRFFPKRYNRLKNAVVPHISSRTLDQRIHELTDAKCLLLHALPNEKPPTHEYYLSEIGRQLEALCSSLSQPITTANLEKLPQYTQHLSILQTYNWNTIWDQIKHIVTSTNSLQTLKQNKSNAVELVDDDTLEIMTEKGIQRLSSDKIRFVWGNLLTYQKLALNDHEKTTYRSSFIFGLLTQLPCVQIDQTDPIIISVKDPIRYAVFPNEYHEK